MLKNGNTPGKDEITGEMIKGGGDRLVKERGLNLRTIEVLAC